MVSMCAFRTYKLLEVYICSRYVDQHLLCILNLDVVTRNFRRIRFRSKKLYSKFLRLISILLSQHTTPTLHLLVFFSVYLHFFHSGKLKNVSCCFHSTVSFSWAKFFRTFLKVLLQICCEAYKYFKFNSSSCKG